MKVQVTAQILQIVLFTSLLQLTISWIVPQPKVNVWRTLAEAMGQDHICLSSASAQDPMSSCLVGIPSKEEELPPALLQLKNQHNSKAPGHVTKLRRKTSLPVSNPLALWREWVTELPQAPEEPQELELLGSSQAFFCVQFIFTPPEGQEKSFSPVYIYAARTWCDKIAHVKVASTLNHEPLSLPRGTFFICGDQAWPGIPSRLTGGPCTIGKLGLFTPNKTQIINWTYKNSSKSATVHKRDLASLNPDCNSEIIHWSKAQATAMAISLPWISVAKKMGELGQFECWVVKQASLVSNTLSDLLSDEEITRKVTIQSRAAIDYLLLVKQHPCEEFKGLCCLNLSSEAEDIHESISKIRDMVSNIKRETEDWFDQLFENWGLSGWTRSIVKTGLLISFILLIILIAFVFIKRLVSKLIPNSTTPPSVNHVEEILIEELAEPEEEEEDFLEQEEI